MAKSEESSTNIIIITETGTITSASAADAAFVGQPYSLVTTFDPSLIQAVPPANEQVAYDLESGSTTLTVGSTVFSDGQNDVGYSAHAFFEWSPSPSSTGSPAALIVGAPQSFEYDFLVSINNPVTPIPNPTTIAGTFSTAVNSIGPPPSFSNTQGDYMFFRGIEDSPDIIGTVTSVTINDVFSPPDSLVAAVLSEEVYHSGNESITPPIGWEEFADYYDPATGYYGEAWGKLSVDANGNPIPGSSYTEIIQVNRGTIFTDTGPGAPADVRAFTNSSGVFVPGVNLGNTAVADGTATWAANEQIVIGQQPNYMASAEAFYNEIRDSSNLPIIETGQSLGGATSDSLIAENYTHDSNLTAITFNALPYGRGIAGLSSAQASALSTPTNPDDPTTATITNYYVGNEQVTQGYLIQAVLWAFGGTALGNSLSLPDLPVLDVNTQLVGRLQEIHDASAGISQLFQSLYPQGSPDYSAALAWLSNVFPTAATTGIPQQISAVLNGASVPTDQSLEGVVFNRNDTVSLVIGGDGSLADAQQIETVSESQASTSDTYQVISVPPDTLSDEQKVWETDVYNSASQLVAITQSKVYTDGSFSVYAYNANHILQNIYSAQSTGDTLVQTYSATGDLNASVDYTPNGTVIIHQYQGDPTLISNSTIDIGSAYVYEIIEDSDQSVLTELDYGATVSNSGTFIGVVTNSDGSSGIVNGEGEFGNGNIISFGTAGLADDILDINQAATGTIDVTLDIEPGTETNISSDQNIGGVQERFAFTGPDEALQVGATSTFIGTISNFGVGDILDLVGISATSATLAANNLLVIQESGGGTIDLQLDPSQIFAGISFDPIPDGNGGTDITASSLVGLTATFSGLSLIHPTTGATSPVGPSNANLAFYALGNEAALNGYLYVVTPSGLDTVDIQTGEIVNSVSATSGQFTADNLTNQLVGVYGNQVEILNPATGALSPIGAALPAPGSAYQTMTAANGVLYFVGSGGATLFSIDIRTGAIIHTAPAATGFYVADPTTGKLFNINQSGVNLVDPATGGLTPVGGTISNPGGLPYGVDAAFGGKVYFEGISSAGTTLYTVDESTGVLLSSAKTTATNIVADIISTTPNIPGVATSILGNTLTAAVLTGQEAVLDPLFTVGGINSVIAQGPGTGVIQGVDAVNNIEVASGGNLLMQGGTIETDPVTVDANGDISGYGKITGNETVNGTITASGGILDLTGNVSGTGKLTVAAGASLQLEGTIASTNSLIFTGSHASLILGASANVETSLSGFGAGDAIGLEGQQVVSAVYATNTNTLVLNALFSLNLAGTYQQSNFSLSAGEVVFSATSTSPTVSSVTPNPVEKSQTTEIGTVTPSTAGDTLTLQQTGGSGAAALQLVSGVEEVIYTAPASVPTSKTDAVSYTVIENDVTATGNASVQLDAGPSITAVTPAAVGKGQTTEVGTVTPGLAGDTLTLKQTGGSGTVALQLVSGVEEVIYTAPASVPANTTDAVTYTVSDQHNDAVASGAASVQLEAAGASITAVTPTTVEKSQTTEIGTVTPSTAGDTLTLQQTGGGGAAALQLVSGVEEVIYTAPASVPTSKTDAVSYTVIENGVTATGNASVQLDAGPSITAVTPAAVGKGQTTEVGTVTPGLAGDTLTLKQTGGSGTVALQLVSGVEEVIYTAPASVPANTTDAVTYTVSDQHNDAVASGAASVQLEAAGASITAVTPTTVEKSQTTEIGTVTPSTAGDTLTLQQTGGSGAAALQLVSGVEEVIYTAPASAPTSKTDAVSYTVIENDVTATGNASVQLDAGPSITAVTPAAVGKGQTTEVGTVTPGLAGDTLTLKQTGGSGTVALQLVSGVEEVIYTAPASVPANTTDAVTYTVSDQHNDAVASGAASVQLEAAGASITAVTPTTVEKSQTTEIGTVTPSTAGDTLTLQQTGGGGAAALQLVSGVEEVIYTAPASVPTSKTDAVSYTVIENGVTATGNASVQLDAGPSITAVTPAAVGKGQTTEVGTVTPGLAGDTLTLKQTGGSGTVALQLVSGVEEVIYTAPASVPANTTDAVTYTVSDQHKDAVASGTASVQLKASAQPDPGPTVTLLPFVPGPVKKAITVATVTPGLPGDTLSLIVTQTPQSGTVTLQSGAVQYTQNNPTSLKPVTFSFEVKDQLGDVTPVYTVVIANGLTNNITGANSGNTDVSLASSLVSRVTLFGNGNVIDGGIGATSVSGGVSNNTIILGAGLDSVTLSGSHNAITLGDGLDSVKLGGGSNVVTLGNGADSVSVGGSGNQITLGNGIDVVHGGTDDTINLAKTTLSLYGTDEMVFIGTGNATVNDFSAGLDLKIGPTAGTDVLAHFASDLSGVVDLIGGIGGFKTAAAAVSALKSDGHGGTLLSFGHNSSLDFTGVTPSQLHAANFQIG